MIFSGITKLFFLLGFLTAMICVGLYSWNKKYCFKWYEWVLSVIGFFMVIFALAWSVSSILEGEPRAASMGLVFFAIPGLLILTLSRRLVLTRSRKLA